MKSIPYLLPAALLLQGCTTPRETHIQHDVLFIAMDDLNDWAGCLGGRPGVQTPNLDSLANEGILFTSAHCSAPACCPSRTSVMTGVRPSTSGIYSNYNQWRQSPVLDTAKTIPEYFREIGYTVKGGGKIFHALSWIRTAYGIDQNDPSIWDEYFPSKTRSMPEDKWPDGFQVDSTGYVTWPLMAGAGTENRPSSFFDYGPLDPVDEYADHKVVNWAINELQQSHDKPLFLAVGIFRPHIPWFAPGKFFDEYPLDSVKLPKILENDLDDVSGVALKWVRRRWQKWMLDNDQWDDAVQAYEACISYSDYELGRLLDGLEKSGKKEQTIIVVWSDHGMHIGEKEHWEKFTLWEESTRVPLIFKVPDYQPAKCNEVVSLLDIYPTLVELTDGKPFPQLEGQSLVPLLRNPSLERKEPAVITYHRNNHAVRTKRWRYIHYHNGDEELYDRRNDPDEFYNLANKPEYRSIMDQLKTWLPKTNVPEMK